jgi:hypothetical protein
VSPRRYTLRSVPFAGSRTASPRPLPSCRYRRPPHPASAVSSAVTCAVAADERAPKPGHAPSETLTGPSAAPGCVLPGALKRSRASTAVSRCLFAASLRAPAPRRSRSAPRVALATSGARSKSRITRSSYACLFTERPVVAAKATWGSSARAARRRASRVEAVRLMRPVPRAPEGVRCVRPRPDGPLQPASAHRRRSRRADPSAALALRLPAGCSRREECRYEARHRCVAPAPPGGGLRASRPLLASRGASPPGGPKAALLVHRAAVRCSAFGQLTRRLAVRRSLASPTHSAAPRRAPRRQVCAPGSTPRRRDPRVTAVVCLSGLAAVPPPTRPEGRAAFWHHREG